MRRLALILGVCGVGACTPAPPAELSLAPVPYNLQVPQEILPRLATGPVEGSSGAQVAADGAPAATTVYYQPDEGQRVIFMTAYWFPGEKFDGLQVPDQPPLFGLEVLRADGHVLSVAGPVDAIFAPDTPDGRNLIALYGIINLPGTYRAAE